MNEHNSMPYMKSLAACLKKMSADGFTEDFHVGDMGLSATKNSEYYHPGQIEIVNFYRFEGESDPDDNAILYAIKTNTGIKGTLVDAYGVYSDSSISQFIKEVENIHKGVKTI